MAHTQSYTACSPASKMFIGFYSRVAHVSHKVDARFHGLINTFSRTAGGAELEQQLGPRVDSLSEEWKQNRIVARSSVKLDEAGPASAEV